MRVRKKNYSDEIEIVMDFEDARLVRYGLNMAAEQIQSLNDSVSTEIRQVWRNLSDDITRMLKGA